MKIEKNIFIAFILNLLFSLIEFIGGILTNSIAIISDSIHDACDAFSIGICYILEKISKKAPDNKYSYGYIRYSVIGSAITTILLIIGSILCISNAIKRLINPVTINYNEMILLSVLGLVINLFATYFTKGDKSLNQKTVNLHMLEDVLGWIIVLIGALIMRFTDINIIDPILSIIVSLFILINAYKNIKIIIDLFLEKTPKNINVDNIKKHLLKINNIINIHHVHIWSIDGYKNYATLHVVVDKNSKNIKNKIREELKEFNIDHVTIELETKDELCKESNCIVENYTKHTHKH